MHNIQNKKEASIYFISLSLAIFVIAKLSAMLGITGLSIITTGLVTVGIVIAAISLILSFAYSLTSALTPDTRRLVECLQIATIIVVIISLMTGGFGSLLAGYIHF